MFSVRLLVFFLVFLAPAGGVTAYGATTDLRLDYLKKWLGGEVVEYDVTYTHRSSLPPEVRRALETEIAKQGVDSDKVALALGVVEKAYECHVRTNAFSISEERHSSDLHDDTASDSGMTVGWISNMVWETVPNAVHMDYERGASYSGPASAMTGERGLNALAHSALLVMGFGIDRMDGTIVWNGSRFRETTQDLQGGSIRGKLLFEHGALRGAVYDYVPPGGGKEGNVHSVVTLGYIEPEDLFPRSIRIEQSVAGQDGRVDTYVHEFTKIAVRLSPHLMTDVILSPWDYVRANPQIANVIVRSNGWLFTAFSGGKWIEHPFLARSGGLKAHGEVLSIVQVALVVILLLPLGLMIGRWRTKIRSRHHENEE